MPKTYVDLSTLTLTPVGTIKLVAVGLPLHDFIKQINEKMISIDGLIGQYNVATTIEQKIAVLQTVDSIQQEMDDDLPDSIITALLPYQTAHSELFLQLKEERKKLAIAWNYKDISVPVTTAHSIVALIQEMHPAKASRLAQILSKGKNSPLDELRLLYSNSEQPDFDNWSVFLDTHELRHYAGVNSYNFLIEHRITKNRCILKIEERLDATKTVERSLREKHKYEDPSQHFLIPAHADRRITYTTASGALKTTSLTVIDFCEAHTLEQIATTIQNSADRLNLAVEIGLANLVLAQKTHEMGAANTDYKGSNLFFIRDPVDKILRAVVADCKGFCAADAKGFIVPPWDGLAISSGYISAPEISGVRIIDETVAVDPLHVYTVAKNIYAVLLSDDEDAIRHSKKTPGFNPRLDFLAVIFQTPEGEKLRDLILLLGAVAPKSRMSLPNAINTLLTMKYGAYCERMIKAYDAFDKSYEMNTLGKQVNRYLLNMQRELALHHGNAQEQSNIFQSHDKLCNALVKLKQLSEVHFGPQDEIMRSFVKDKFTELLTHSDRKQVIHEIDGVLQAQMNPVTQLLHQIVRNLQKKIPLSYEQQVKDKQRLAQLEAAMSNLPLLERGNIFDETSLQPSKRKVTAALNSRSSTLFGWFGFPHLGKRELPTVEYQQVLKLHNKNVKQAKKSAIVRDNTDSSSKAI